MGQNIKTEDKVLEVFYENPARRFTVREITKRTRIPKSTVQKYLVQLRKQGLIDKKNRASLTLLFKTKKTNFFVEKIVASGLIEELVERLNPSLIILFGSIRKGDSVSDSDIDLFIESSHKKEPDLQKYEKKIKHGIQLFVENDINRLPPQLFNNVINGIKLYGSFTLK